MTVASPLTELHLRCLSTHTVASRRLCIWRVTAREPISRLHHVCAQTDQQCPCLSALRTVRQLRDLFYPKFSTGGSVAEWLACWTQAQKARVQIAVATLSGNSLRQTAHTHCASVHQAAKLVAALLRVAGVTAGLAESNGSLPPGL